MQLHQAGHLLCNVMRDMVTWLQNSGITIHLPDPKMGGDIEAIRYMSDLVDCWHACSEHYVAVRSDFNRNLEEFLHA